MNFIDNLKVVVKQPRVLKPYKHLLLLSHMRANTSLFGHIVGNHPKINGYYEMHIGYYSWKSLFRQKLLFAASHDVKWKSTYFFDKILHTEHHINESILNRPDVTPIFSLRHPISTIPSIIKLYRQVDPAHEFATKNGALTYYLKRLNALKNLAVGTQNYIYIEADAIRLNTNKSLANLSAALDLQSSLTPEFQQQKLTGVGNSGDHSGNLLTGQVNKKTNSYDNFDFSEHEIEILLTEYNNARTIMETAASCKILADE